MEKIHSKEKTHAALLALFLGGLGVHRFYLGKMLSGIFYALFFWTFIPAIFGLVEAVYLLTMSPDKFFAHYPGEPWGSGTVKAGQPTPETHVKCPDCRELVLMDARVCKHCGCKLIPQTTSVRDPAV